MKCFDGYVILYKAGLYLADEENPNITVCGMLYAEDYADAAAQIDAYYGAELQSMEITMYDSGAFEMPEKYWKKCRNAMNTGWNWTEEEEKE